MKHTGNLVIRKRDTTDYSDLTEVTGCVWLYPGATLTAPAYRSERSHMLKSKGE